MLDGELKQFIKHLATQLLSLIPELKSWEPCQLLEHDFYFVPDRTWKVVKDDNIAICFVASTLLEPSFYTDEDDPYVGLYVPPSWSKSARFNESLKKVLPQGFTHADSEPEYPVWATISTRPHVKRNSFDPDGFGKDVVAMMKKLVARREKISALITELKKK